MNTKKLTHVHVYIIGAVLALIVGVGLFYFLLNGCNFLLHVKFGIADHFAIAAQTGFHYVSY